MYHLTKIMNKEQAISVLVTGCKIAQSKGAFTLEDASVILEAIKTLSPAPAPVEPKVEEAIDKSE
jgi:hypothetical protein